MRGSIGRGVQVAGNWRPLIWVKSFGRPLGYRGATAARFGDRPASAGSRSSILPPRLEVL